MMPSRDGKIYIAHLFPGKKFRDLSVLEKRIWYREFYKRNPKRYARKAKEYRDRLMDKFFEHYGNACLCCGEKNRLFLTIEHLNGGGSEHRRQRPGGVNKIVVDIRRAGWPKEYATLCMNCNFGKWRNGGTCPHVVEKAKVWLEEIRVIQNEINESSKRIIG